MRSVYVFCADGFEEVEGLTAVDLLRRAGIDVKMVSIMDRLQITGSHNISVNTDILIEDIKEEADMLLLPGGMPGTNYLREHEGLADLLKKQYEAGKWIAAICAAPSVFGGLGFLKDKEATSYPGCLDGVPVGGYKEDPVVVDGNVVTSRRRKKMQQESKIGFLWQYVIACVHPSQYKELIRKKKGAFIGYISVLIMFLVFIENVIPFAAWTASVGGFENLFLERIPGFTLEKGEFHSESPIDFTIGGVVRVKADSSVEQFKESDFQSDYVQELLVGKKNILIKMPSGKQVISLSQFKNWRLNNQGLVEMLPALYMFLAFYLVVLLITKAVQYLLVALAFALICRGSVRRSDGKMVSMAESFYIAVYARTLAAIIGSVNAALGYRIDSMILMIVTVFITMGFIMRGEISVLDTQTSKE